MFDRFDPELEAFRAEVREYLTEAMRPDAVAGHADPRDLTGLDVAFERALQMDAGTRVYLAVNYPVEMGGGADADPCPVQRGGGPSRRDKLRRR